jgi:hypothetical protein
MKNTPWCNFLSFSAVGVILLMVGCSGDDGAPGATGADGAPGPGAVPDQDIIVQVDTTGDGTADTIAVLDPNTFAVKRSAAADLNPDSSLNNSHKSYFHTALQWVGGGGNLWAFDKDTLVLASRVDNPSFQMNREGTVGQAQVNTKSAATTANLPKEMKAYLGRTLLTPEEAAKVDMCELMNLAGASSSATKAPADTIIHNMGYSPVGLETSPDGNMIVVGVRQGDHLLFIDNDSASPTFGTPVRFVDQRRGVIKDKTNAVVGTFTSQYTGFVGATGTAPGNLHTTRAGGATGGEIDGETYVEPCDTNLIRNAAGEVWFWSVDVDGDTYTLARVDTITSPTPTVVQITVPVIDDNATVGGASGLQYVGPWMGSMLNRAAGGEMIGTSENEGENSEGIWDLSDPANPVEVGRYVDNLATVKGGGSCVGFEGLPGGPTLNPGLLPNSFVDGNTYAVNVDFTSTGGACTAVNYTYNSLPGDDLSGSAGAAYVTTAYLAKDTATDPGPNYILNGLAGRAGTSEGNVATITGSGTDSIIYSDELWLPILRQGIPCITAADCDIFQIVDLSTDPPWLLNENINLPSQFAGKFGPDNRYYQVANGNLEIIDASVTPRNIFKVVKLFDATTGSPYSIRSVNHRMP